ncbi:unnamed protein product [Moneuplotes crassus]|uniref:J domain-containing protein n=1 Tax=Euplotes crassus TaxID=5936 RepID=A0AAD1UG86_EUPCR|nr:unnamed protein product [Moneuplotes crassus]
MWTTRSLFRTPRRGFFWRTPKPKLPPKPDLYKVLGVDKKATQRQIKMAYFEKAKMHHPDVSKSGDTSEYNFEMINEAYQTLNDPKKRKTYNVTGLFSHEQEQGMSDDSDASDFSDETIKRKPLLQEIHDKFPAYKRMFQYNSNAAESLLNQKFGAVDSIGRGLTLKTDHEPNIVRNVTLDFEELAELMRKEDPNEQFLERELTYKRFVLCHDCGGGLIAKGAYHHLCDSCDGESYRFEETDYGPDFFDCLSCKGTGIIIKDVCKTCEAKGVLTQQEKLRVKIPAGVRDGEYLRIKNRGNFCSDLSYGDFFVKINIYNIPKDYEIQGYNIVTTQKVPVGKAVLGGQEYFNTLYGVVSSHLPPRVEPNRKFELKGYGLPIPYSNGRKGKHIFIIEYVMP